MSETLTMNETPADQPEFNADEQDSLAVAESLEGGEQPLLAGKFKDQGELEKAYLELQQKLGGPRDEEEEASEDEGEAVEEELALTVAPYSQFASSLHPQRVNAGRSGSSGWRNDEPGSCTPSISIRTWLLLAVP